MRIAAIVVWTLSLLLVALTLLPMTRSAKWWIRTWDYPRLQLAVALAVMAALQLALLPMHAATITLLLLTVAALAWQAYRIVPYTPLRRPQSQPAVGTDPSSTVSVLIANVLQHNREASALLRIVEAADPDILIAVETCSWWDRQLAGLTQRYPHTVRHPLENTYGMHLFSRLALEDVRVRELVTPGIPSVSAGVRLRSGQRVDFHAVHPEPPQPGNDVEERDAELLLIAKEVRASDRPTIVAGDLNDVAWSHTTRLFQRVSGLLDPRVGRGLYPTFHAKHWFARWPLDHIFHSAAFRLQRLEVLGAFGSDHFPIYAAFLYDPGAAHEHEVPSADRADLEEAGDKIAEGRSGGRVE